MPGIVGMTAVCRAAAIATDLTCRAARETHRRPDGPVRPFAGAPSANGESALQRWILRFSQAGKPIHVADVGHNVGRGSESMLAAASPAGTNSLYPAPETIHVAQRCLVTNAPGKG
jgi:hypothetical protein